MKKKIWLFSDLLEKKFQRVEEQLILFIFTENTFAL